MTILAAGMIYFLLVFSVGFLLGPIRVLLLEPRLGAIGAVLCEAPLLLLAMVAAARWVRARLGLPDQTGVLLQVGGFALALVLLADLTVGLTLRGLGVNDQLARFATPEGWIYVGLLVVFALMPLATSRSSRRH